jgi:hypothetical protein
MKKFLSFVFLSMLLLSGCNQNMEEVSSGETLENSPKPLADPNAKPLAASAAASADGEVDVPPFVKAFFMHTWVEALYGSGPPPNKHPNPSFESPLKDPVNGRVWCTDCHVNTDIDFSKIPKMRTPQVADLENNHAYMVALMKKWVARLNSDQFGAKAKLKGPVTCLTCHATNPENDVATH